MPTTRKSKVVYKIRRNPIGIKDEDAVVIGKELVRLEKTGRLTTERVVREAADPQSKIHGYFNWDDSEAAHEYRKYQARWLMSSVVVVYDVPDGHVETRGWFNVTEQVNAHKERHYTSFVKVQDSPELRKQVVTKARKQLDYWLATYQHYEELFPISEAIREVLETTEET